MKSLTLVCALSPIAALPQCMRASPFWCLLASAAVLAAALEAPPRALVFNAFADTAPPSSGVALRAWQVSV